MLKLALLLVVCLWHVVAKAEPPVREVTYEADLGSRIPMFDKGYLIVFQQPWDSGGISVFGGDGKRLYQTVLQAADGSPARIVSAAADSDGTVAVGVGKWLIPGSGGIVILNRSGQRVRSIPTDPFIPYGMSFAPDHSIWTVGCQRDPQRPSGHADPNDYPIFRKYSPDGLKLGGYVSKSTFAGGLAPGTGPVGSSRISIVNGLVGATVTSGTSGNQREWIELDSDGNLRGHWPLDEQVAGQPVFMATGEVYHWRVDRSLRRSQFARLDRGTGQWVVLGKAPDEGVLLGSDADNLVFYRGGVVRYVPTPK